MVNCELLNKDLKASLLMLRLQNLRELFHLTGVIVSTFLTLMNIDWHVLTKSPLY